MPATPAPPPHALPFTAWGLGGAWGGYVLYRQLVQVSGCVCVCLSWSVTQCLCTCIITAEGAEQVVLKIPLMDYYYLSARLFSLTPFCTSQLRTPSYCRWMRSRGHQISLSSLLFYTGRESIAHKGWDKRCAVVVNEKEYSTITSSNRERASLWLHHFVCPLLI